MNEKDVERTSHGLYKVLSQHLPGNAEITASRARLQTENQTWNIMIMKQVYYSLS